MANLAIVPALVGRGDAVFADKLNHASLIDAAQLSRADSQRYAHGDVARWSGHARRQQRQAQADPDRRRVQHGRRSRAAARLLELAERHDAWLVIDDAHGFRRARPSTGAAASRISPAGQPAPVVLMGTLGKAAGVAGAFVAGRARSSNGCCSAPAATSSPPPPARSWLQRWRSRRSSSPRRRRPRQPVQAHRQLRDGLADTRWRLLPSATAIQPIIVGDNAEAVRVANALLERGLWVPAIRPPTVPKGTARLRVSLSAAHTEAHIRALVDALKALA
jgi:8-amino-7-oxononanoate synthase